MTTIYSKAGTDAAISAATDALTPEDVGADPAGTAAAAIAALGLGTAAQSDATDFAPAASGAYPVQQVTLTGNLAYALPVDAPADQVISVVFTQDGTGGHTVTYDALPVSVDLTAGAPTTVELHPVGSGYVVRYPAPPVGTTPGTIKPGDWRQIDLTGMPSNVDVDEAIAVISQSVVGITTYAGAPNAIVHPSVVFVADGWQGWRYWMAYAPFNDQSVRLENPCIAVSNDGDTWTVPVGLANPVEPDPGVGVGYNADPVLCLTPDGSKLLMVWKRNAATKQTCLRTSVDGVTWTPRQVLFENPYEDVSPALLWDGMQYRMWTIRHDTNPNTLWMRTASAPEGPWSEPVACTVSSPSGAELWHIDITRVGQQYHTVMTSTDEPVPTGQKHWFGKSDDGITWTLGREALMRTMSNPQNAFYKACILPKIAHDGLRYDMWYSSRIDFALRKTEVSFIRSQRVRDINAEILGAVAGLSPSIFADSFDRTDTASGLGTSNSGHNWSSVMGNVMGIQSGQAYLPVAANSRSIVDLGVSDFQVGVSFKTLGTSGYLLFRYVDASNLWRVGHTSGAMILQKIVGGALTTITPNTATVRAGDRIEVRCVGSDIRVLINGLPVLRVTDTANMAGTRIGINVDNTGARFDNLTASTV